MSVGCLIIVAFEDDALGFSEALCANKVIAMLLVLKKHINQIKLSIN